MGEPADRVGFARARAVLDQIVFSRPVRPHIGDDAVNGVELVIAREDQFFLTFLLAGHRVALGLDLQVHEARQDVEPAVLRPDFFPEIGGLVASGVVGIAGAALTTLVERQKARARALEPGGHVDQIAVDRKMHQGAALEGEQRIACGGATGDKHDGGVVELQPRQPVRHP
jgi:hypothetical protein